MWFRRLFKPRVTVHAYLSHPIRGSGVDKASKKTQISNGEKAATVARELERLIPGLKIYCPGDAEKFTFYSYSLGFLTDEQILDIDCRIISDGDLLLSYDFDTSHGVKIEKTFARESGIPIYSFTALNRRVVREIRKLVKEIGSKWDDHRMGL